MNPFRAKRIADHFSSIGTFNLTNQTHGITEPLAKLWVDEWQSHFECIFRLE